MFCVKCGVELDDSQKTCPLCKTPVFHPDIKQGEGEPSYPEYVPTEKNASPQGVLFIITCLLLLPILITTAVDLLTGGGISWSGYVTGSIILFYTVVILPSWFKRPNPAVFIPCDFAAIILFLFYINYSVSGSWFMTFAFPVTGAFGLIVTAVAVLSKYLKRGYLYIFGGAFVALAAYCFLIEVLITVTFDHVFVFWSLYTAIGLLIIAGMLLTIAICKPLRESLEKKFFI